MPHRRRLAPGGVLAIGAAIAVSAASCGSPAIHSPAAYKIRTPSVAGGWKISASGPGGFTTADLQASRLQILVDGKARHAVAAFYDDPATSTDPNTGIQVVFDGATGSLGNPAGLIARLRADPNLVTTLPGAIVTWHEVAPGPHGGRAACGDVTDPAVSALARVPFCAWQTTTTFGQLTLLPNALGPLTMTADALGDLMRRMRLDVETPA
jgi:hypothetical protein